MHVEEFCVVTAVDEIDRFVKEHGGKIRIADIGMLTLALREQRYFQCPVNVKGLSAIVIGVTGEIARVYTYFNLNSPEMTEILSNRILARCQTWRLREFHE